MHSYDDRRCDVDHLIAEHGRIRRLRRTARANIVAGGGPDGDATGADIVQTLAKCVPSWNVTLRRRKEAVVSMR